MNYHEIKQPDKNAVVNVNLAEVPKGQTIYVYTETSFKYNINVSSGTIINEEFYLDNSPIKTTNGAIVLNPRMLEGKNSSELKIKLKLGSGTGSLAELIGEETSNIEVKFPVKFVDPKIQLNIDQRINSDSNLEIFWKKPILEGAEVESYTIYTYKTNSPDHILEVVSVITDPSQTSYTDKDYAYGVKLYKIATKFKSSRVPISEDLYYVKYESLTDKMFTTSTAESFKLKIKWKNPNLFASKYVVKFKDEIFNVSSGNDEVYVSRPLFPATLDYYELYILPEEANFSEYKKYNKVINYYKDLKFEDPLDFSFFADLKNNMILGKYNYNQYNMRLFDKDDLHTKGDIILPAEKSGMFRLSAKSGKVGMFSKDGDGGKFYIYSDYTLNTLITSFTVPGPNEIEDFFITDDDKLIINYPWYSTQSRIYNSNTGKLINVVEEGLKKHKSAISYDGQFLINYVRVTDENSSYKIYKYNSDNSLTLLRNQTDNPISKVYFHPLKTNHVIIQHIATSDSDYRNNFTIYELPHMKEVITVMGQYGSVDKFTGNLIYEAYPGKTRILNKTYDKTIYALDLASPNYMVPLLINNYIILEGKYYNHITE